VAAAAATPAHAGDPQAVTQCGGYAAWHLPQTRLTCQDRGAAGWGCSWYEGNEEALQLVMVLQLWT